jgi:hypothetical protein
MLRSVLTALAAVALAVSLASPAHATLQIAISVDGTAFSCADNGACDSDPRTGVLALSNMTINGVVLSGLSLFSAGTPANPSSNGFAVFGIGLSINNTTNAAQAIAIALSDTSFSTIGSFPLYFSVFAAGTFQPSMSGSRILTSYFDDPGNAQGADTVTDTPGNLTASFSVIDNRPPRPAGPGFNVFQGGIPVSETAPFSMTMTADILLAANTQLLNYGQAIQAAVPEPSTWVMMLLGFAGLGFAFRRRRAAIGAH